MIFKQLMESDKDNTSCVWRYFDNISNISTQYSLKDECYWISFFNKDTSSMMEIKIDLEGYLCNNEGKTVENLSKK